MGDDKQSSLQLRSDCNFQPEPNMVVLNQYTNACNVEPESISAVCGIQWAHERRIVIYLPTLFCLTCLTWLLWNVTVDGLYYLYETETGIQFRF